jgi:predicted tellurium resistance membrane protein TerC
MDHLFTYTNLVSLLTLTLLEIVLGIDNVIFVSIFMGQLSKTEQPKAKRLWMIFGIILRILLLVLITWTLHQGSEEGLFKLFGHVVKLENIVMLGGGLFLFYKTVKEIHENLEGDDKDEASIQGKKGKTFAAIIMQIIVLDLVFSFDSIITAVGMAKEQVVQVTAVVIAAMVMFIFADKISQFIHKHPTLKMLALSFLLLVGFTLFFEGLHPLHGMEIPKGYVYFAMLFSFLVELLNMRFRSKKKPIALRQSKTIDEI